MGVGLGREWRFDDAVLGALDRVVGPAGQEIAGVDHDCVGDGRRVDEGVVWAEDLQAASVVLE